MTTFIDNHSSIDSSIASQSAINHRVLLSLPEAAKIIGTKGSTIDKVRNDNNVKIGISEKIPGCSDRILSCAGTIINVANALADVMNLLNEDVDLTSRKYHFHFLNHILPPPSNDEISGDDQSNLNKIGTLRVIMLNSHLSSIIGKNGQTIKSLIDKHGVKIVASRDFLPDSSERILEVQGFAGSVANTLIEISEILIQDIDITFSSERKYFPHLKSNGDNPRSNHHNNNNSNNSNNNNNNDSGNYHNNNESSSTSPYDNQQNQHDVDMDHSNNNYRSTQQIPTEDLSQLDVLIPEAYVGAVVGRQGNRIANLRKFTKTKILIEKHDNNNNNSNNNGEITQHEQLYNDAGEPCRKFTIVSNSMKQIKLAESMLLRNLETEIERRMTKEHRDAINVGTQQDVTLGTSTGTIPTGLNTDDVGIPDDSNTQNPATDTSDIVSTDDSIAN